MIRDDELKELKRIADEATEGPWHRCLLHACREHPVDCGKSLTSERCSDRVVDFMSKKNLEFVIAAREYMTDLVAEVKYYRERLADHNDEMIAYDAKVKQLEMEADWLANKLSLSATGSCPRDDSPDYPCNKADNVPHDCVACWRKTARKAVQDE